MTKLRLALTATLFTFATIAPIASALAGEVSHG